MPRSLTAAILLLSVPALARGQITAGTWSLRGRTCTVACAVGRCQPQTCRRSSGGVLYVKKNGTYLTPSGTCDDTGVQAPDEVGTIQPGPRGSFLFVPANLEDLEAALRDCLAARFDVQSFEFRTYRTQITPRGDSALKGTNRVVAVGRINGRRVRVGVLVRFKGTLVQSSAVGAFVDEAAPD